MPILRFLLLLLFFLGQSLLLSGKHIIGGDMSYRCLSVDTVNKFVNFAVTLKMYRDCYAPQAAEFDEQIKIGIYEKLPNGFFRNVKKLDQVILKTPIVNINADDDNPCLIVPENVCVQEGTYEFQTGILRMSTNSYYIAYQRCCRNETISNIIAPGMDGAAFVIEITPEAQRVCNNSPVFKKFPPIVICINSSLNFDHSIIDRDGDQVTYEFCTPLVAGGQDGTLNGSEMCYGVKPDPFNCPPPFNTVNYRTPIYSANAPLAGNPVVTIDPLTGIISGKPEIQGQFVVGVCIREYRNGILLTETRRDFQFNVTYCEPKVHAKLKSDSILNGKKFIINLCGKSDLDFENLSTDAQFIREYDWTFSIGGMQQKEKQRNARFSFPGLGSYFGKMVLNPGSECSDSADIQVNVFPEIRAGFNFVYDTCIAGPVLFSDQSFSGSGQLTNWDWTFASSGNSVLANPSFVFNTPGLKPIQLQVRDINGCVDDTVAMIPYFPVPPLLVVDPSAFDGCTPLNVCFNNLSVPIDTSYTIVWDFGDGKSSSDISPCHSYKDGGLYSVKLQITSPIGCYIEKAYPNWINVRQSPKADFSYTPDKFSSFQKTASFTDLSTNTNSRLWIFDQTDKSSLINPIYTFRDTGRQSIQLIAINNNGCRDTLTQYLDVEPIVTYHMPNAFTPNGDSKNEYFLGLGVLDGMGSFEMSIWDRWGGRVFKTNDPREGWNGRFENSGSNLPNGVYVYLVRYTTPRNQLIELKGFANLIR